MSDSLVSKPCISWRHRTMSVLVSQRVSVREWTCVWRADITLFWACIPWSWGSLDEIALTTNPVIRRNMLLALLVDRYWPAAARGDIAVIVAWCGLKLRRYFPKEEGMMQHNGGRYFPQLWDQGYRTSRRTKQHNVNSPCTQITNTRNPTGKRGCQSLSRSGAPR